jgi:hypothetical protein
MRVEHMFYQNQVIMREWSIFYMRLQPECERRADLLQESSQV